MKNPDEFCKIFYVSHFLPISYYENGKELYTAGFPEGTPSYGAILHALLAVPQSPAVYMMPDVGLYGLVRLKHPSEYIVVGPARSGEVSERTVHAYIVGHIISRERQADIEQFLCSIPHFSYNRFVYLLLHLHLALNEEVLSMPERFDGKGVQLDQKIAARHADKAYQARDERHQHGTYFFERQLLELVGQGDPERIRAFLLETAANLRLEEGVLADTPLRQAKNVFVGLVTLVGKVGAIPGGMDVEQAYQLIDTYIQECERLQSIDDVKNLQYNMLLDFTSRVQQSKLPGGISDEIFSCIQYIGAHLNDVISVQDVAEHIGRGRTYLEKHFKLETGKSVGEYITECRMREAKNLLKHTDKSLAEISDYLHFSSQPYFQNVFKKMFGITPAMYRKEHSD
ncbi:MAG: AraC family transcriptional regulator [Eubacterium sp.]|nr:AraC family transcriptional regulator [Eubacterium sp.]